MNKCYRFFLFAFFVIAGVIYFSTHIPHKETKILFITVYTFLCISIFITENFFTKPTDVLVSSISILLLLIGNNFTGIVKNIACIFILYAGTMAFLSVLAFLSNNINKSENDCCNKISNISKTIACKIGNSKLIYSIFLLLLFIEYFNEENLIPIFIILFILFILDGSKTTIPKITNFLSLIIGKNKKRDDIGLVLATESNKIVIAKLYTSKETSVKLFDEVYLKSIKDNKTVQCGAIINILHLPNEKKIKILLLDEKVENKNIESIKKNVVYKSDNDNESKIKNTFAGIIAEDSSIDTIYFKYSEVNKIEEGTLLEVKIDEAKVYYQVINGYVKNKELKEDNSQGYILGKAIQLGRFESDKNNFSKYGRAPEINTLVLKYESNFDSLSFLNIPFGKVIEIKGQKASILLDSNINILDLFYNNEIRKNISVGSFIKIKKECVSIIAKIDNTKLQNIENNFSYSQRIIEVSIIGYIKDNGEFEGGIKDNGEFEGGIKELAFIGNECFIAADEVIKKIHEPKIKENDKPKHISIGNTVLEAIPVNISVDSLFSSHIAIFGNTGSGKSYTLARLYNALLSEFKDNQKFKDNFNFLLFDFNGEYSGENCIFNDDTIERYKISNLIDNPNKLKITKEEIYNADFFSIIAEASEKTQKPFIRRALNYYKNVLKNNTKENYFSGIIKQKTTSVLSITNENKTICKDYLEAIINIKKIDNSEDFHDDNISFIDNQFKHKKTKERIDSETDCEKKYTHAFLQSNENEMTITNLYKKISQIKLEDKFNIKDLLVFFYLQLIQDILDDNAKNEHIAPVVGRLKSKIYLLDKIFEIVDNDYSFFSKSFVVIDIHDIDDVSIKKLVPLLVSKYIYNRHKKYKGSNEKKILNVIVDEAHNIFSYNSVREASDWKDYRLEVFEEIIKEGRKFGVYMTIASQRPSDISETIISQCHNYFIHKLVNHKDLEIVKNAISYMDKATAESISALPQGHCIFSGTSVQMPMSILVSEFKENEKHYAPKSNNIYISDIIK